MSEMSTFSFQVTHFSTLKKLQIIIGTHGFYRFSSTVILRYGDSKYSDPQVQWSQLQWSSRTMIP